MTARPASTRTLQPWFTTLLDLGGCSRFEITVHLYEHEPADFHFETWPAAVRTQVVKYFREWEKDNPKREVVAITFAVSLVGKDARQCVTIVHHADKADERKHKPKGEPDPTPAPAPGGGPSSTPPAAACAPCSE